MIRPLREADFDAAAALVNACWRSVYAGYVGPELLSDAGCEQRSRKLKSDFASHRLEEYVWEEEGRVRAALSAGPSEDPGRAGAFELWRLYLAPEVRGRGVGGRLPAFAETRAAERGYAEMVIWAFRENVRAVSFYRKHGYRTDGEHYLGEPYRAWGVRLAKNLPGREARHG